MVVKYKFTKSKQKHSNLSPFNVIKDQPKLTWGAKRACRLYSLPQREAMVGTQSRKLETGTEA